MWLKKQKRTRRKSSARLAGSRLQGSCIDNKQPGVLSLPAAVFYTCHVFLLSGRFSRRPSAYSSNEFPARPEVVLLTVYTDFVSFFKVVSQPFCKSFRVSTFVHLAFKPSAQGRNACEGPANPVFQLKSIKLCHFAYPFLYPWSPDVVRRGLTFLLLYDIINLGFCGYARRFWFLWCWAFLFASGYLYRYCYFHIGAPFCPS